MRHRAGVRHSAGKMGGYSGAAHDVQEGSLLMRRFRDAAFFLLPILWMGWVTQIQAGTPMAVSKAAKGASLRVAPRPIVLTAVRIEEGEILTDRLVHLKLRATGSPIRWWRIAESQSALATAPWIRYDPRRLMYRLQSVGAGWSGIEVALYVQVRGDDFPGTGTESPALRENRSKILSRQVSYRPTFDVVLKAPTQLSVGVLSGVKIHVKRVRAASVEGSTIVAAGMGCRFEKEQTDYKKIGKDAFEVKVYGRLSITGTTQRQCRLDVLIKTQNRSGRQLDQVVAPVTVAVAQPAPRKTFTVGNTFPLLPYLEITPPSFLSTSSFGHCKGQSIGLAGRIPIGLVVVGNDLAFRVRSGPAGVTCERTVSAPRLRRGWGMTLNFREYTQGSRCLVSRDGRYYHLAVMKFVFNRGKTYAGWKTEQLVDRAPGVGWGAVKKLTVLLSCKPTPSNTSEALARLESVELIAPPGYEGPLTWSAAFQ